MQAALCVLRTAIVAAALLADGVALAADYQLVSAVVVSRHGVRSPIAGHLPLGGIAADPWPAWPVPSGHLTLRGATLAQAARRLLPGLFRRARNVCGGPASTAPVGMVLCYFTSG